MRVRGGSRARFQKPSLLLVLPAFLLLVAVTFAPQLSAAYYSFTRWNGVSADAEWVGWGNYSEIFNDPVTRDAFMHTLYLAGSFVVLVNVIGLVLALGVNRSVKSRNLLRAVFFLPVVVSPLALGFVWRYVFQYEGLLNQTLRFVGLGEWRRTWLADPDWALWTILVALVWQYVGLAMVLFLAGLQGVPDELLEAAAVDGASTWTRFRRITLPLLAPAMTVTITLTTILGLRVFDQVKSLTDGGPVDSTETLSTQVYEQTFVNGRFGYGSALAFLLAGLIAILGVSQAMVLRRREGRN